MTEPILLVAKPWRGCLGRYLFWALRDLFGMRVQWWPTYPATPLGRMRYRMDRSGWRRRLTERIDRGSFRAVIVLNPLREFAALRARDHQVLWLTDHGRVDAAVTAPFARVFVSDPGYAPVAGAEMRAEVLPFAHYPGLHRPPLRPARRPRLAFIGNHDPARTPVLRALLDAGVPLTVHGNDFLRSGLFWRFPRHVRPPVDCTAMGPVYAQYGVALNLHAAVVRGGTNMRTFECAGYRLPQLVDRRPGLEALFEPDTEITVFDAPGEAVDLAWRMLADPAPFEARAQRAHRRALEEHTYYHRIARMLEGIVDPIRIPRFD